MGKKKIFTATDLSVPEVHKSVNFTTPEIQELIDNPSIKLPTNPTGRVNLDFSKWYGCGFDAIVYVCHVQILRFLAKQDAEVEVATVCTMYTALCAFFSYLELRAIALGVVLKPNDINRDLIDGYITHQSTLGITHNSQRSRYSLLKSILLPLGRRGIFKLITKGEEKTFPLNPYPNSNKSAKSAIPFTKKERDSIATALRQAIQPIWDAAQPLTSELITYGLLIVALHTGRNTTPLLEMTPDCLRPHPKENFSFLVLWKRRGHNSNKVTIRKESEAERTIESMPSIRFSVDRLIRHVISRTALFRFQHEELKSRIWIYQSREKSTFGMPRELTQEMMRASIKKLVTEYSLKDANGQPLKLNTSRLRATFANRIFEILDGDLIGTARAIGSTPRTTDNNYMAVTAESKKNWRFMGEILVEELLSNTIGATYQKTPIAKCSDNTSGRYISTKDEMCTSFLNCIRCNHFVITAEDLYKLFSFYYRVYHERTRMNAKRWTKELSHIPRIIDNYIIAEGLRRGAFKQSQVEKAKALAQECPHPFWRADMIPTLEVFS